jgi:hypothetical protein
VLRSARCRELTCSAQASVNTNQGQTTRIDHEEYAKRVSMCLTWLLKAGAAHSQEPSSQVRR